MIRLFAALALALVLGACAQLQTTDCRKWPLDPAQGGSCAVSKEFDIATDFWIENLAPRKWRFIYQDLENPQAQKYIYTNMARKTCPSGFREAGEKVFSIRIEPTKWEDTLYTRGREKERPMQKYIAWNFECIKDDWNGVWPSILAP